MVLPWLLVLQLGNTTVIRCALQNTIPVFQHCSSHFCRTLTDQREILAGILDFYRGRTVDNIMVEVYSQPRFSSFDTRAHQENEARYQLLPRQILDKLAKVWLFAVEPSKLPQGVGFTLSIIFSPITIWLCCNSVPAAIPPV